MRPPLIVHVIYSLGVGGLENGLVNLINNMPRDRYRHAIVCLHSFTDFAKRIQGSDVPIYSLDKKPGKDLGLYVRLGRLLRQLKPDIVHTRNLAALEGQIVAAITVSARRVHGEHGREVDVAGLNMKYNLLRSMIRPFVHRYIAVSRDLEQWLINRIGVEPSRIKQIYNGVDSQKFRPWRVEDPAPPWQAQFASDQHVIIGSVGRMAAIKDHQTLVRAFIMLIQQHPQLRETVRLVIVGDGPCRENCAQLLAQAGLSDYAYLMGERNDVAELMRAMDIFVLPSLGEGISNTILEAMATGLPVLATQVGGNPELVQASVTGRLVPANTPRAMAQALFDYVSDAQLRDRHGSAGRAIIERQYSLPAMVNEYMQAYDMVLR
ncbi:MAG: TIGR03088 family PEP-CTERM/XrtA system glycosyltransferase [Sulfurimicrobium sp.]|nr:TIGR03088 family PEP-CTERM/XrtA system glycosyltransferase [Sulfurimicrobium sp.]